MKLFLTFLFIFPVLVFANGTSIEISSIKKSGRVVGKEITVYGYTKANCNEELSSQVRKVRSELSSLVIVRENIASCISKYDWENDETYYMGQAIIEGNEVI